MKTTKKKHLKNGLNNLKRNKMENLYSYVFHYNPYMKLWVAIPTNRYTDYFSGQVVEEVLVSREIETLIDLVCKGDEFIKLIK